MRLTTMRLVIGWIVAAFALSGASGAPHRLEVTQSTLVADSGYLYSHALEVQRDVDGAVETIRWEDHAREVKIAGTHGDQVILTGNIGGAAETISIVDIARKQLDFFILCRWPSISPSGRFLAYLQFIPRHGDPDDDEPDAVVLYDLEKSRDSQRVKSNLDWVIESAQQGVIVHPRELAGQLCDPPVETPSGATQGVFEPLVWEDNGEVLAFTVASDRKQRHVRLRIGKDGSTEVIEDAAVGSGAEVREATP